MGQQPQQTGIWTNVAGFAISPDGSYMVLSMRLGERTLLYESRFQHSVWSEPQPIHAINSHGGGFSSIGGPVLSHDNRFLYFHADFEGGEGGFDIYFSERQQGQWGRPQSIGTTINSAEDELYPAISPQGNRLIFSRNRDESDVRKPRRAPVCKKLFVSNMDAQGNWTDPIPTHPDINRACEYGPWLANDNKTLYFSAIDQDNHRDGYNLFVSTETIEGIWSVPRLISSVASGETLINPRIAGEYLYFLMQTEGRRETEGSVFRIPLPQDYSPVQVFQYKGIVRDALNNMPLEAEIRVLEPLTFNTKGTYLSDQQTGTFSIPLPDHAAYMVEVTKEGYSTGSYFLDFTGDKKIKGPENIGLFNRTELTIRMLNARYQEPVDALIQARRITSNRQGSNGDPAGERIQPQRTDTGIYSISLPVGEKYQLIVQKEHYHRLELPIDISGDVMFSSIHKKLILTPQTSRIALSVMNDDTGEAVDAEVWFVNTSRDYRKRADADPGQPGRYTGNLHHGETYDIVVTGPEGYAFHSQTLRYGEELSGQQSLELDIRLIPLKAGRVTKLNNILFAENSANLLRSSFSELDRLADLMKVHAAMNIEILVSKPEGNSKAHSARTADRQAEAIMNYLSEKGIDPDRITYRGRAIPAGEEGTGPAEDAERSVRFKIKAM